jgi:serine/threonine protein kinase/Tol biopolymer transport system component
MNPERWQQVKRLYNSALELRSKQREAFLEEACAGDESLRSEIDLLLARRPEAEGFFEAPAMELAAQALARDRSAEPSADLTGNTLLHYSVTRKIGAGGMGEVYQAYDLKLNRQVALKILPDSFAHDPERLARFDREAKLLASLNHPNIAAIYGLEEARDKKFLVLELVEGETLAQRIKKGRLPLEEAVKLCRQIAEGLEAAHEKGVVHRDLKPGNVMIAGNDKIKILDFGLAKVLAAESAATAATQSPTITEAMTGPGVILGTAAYMSPEQANGKAVDKRADIWAFGCVLYECLTGRRAFPGDTVSETIASVLGREPGWDALPATTPIAIRKLLERCLRKNPRERIHDVSDVRIEIEEELEEGTAAGEGPVVSPRKKLDWRLLAAVSTLATAAVVIAVILLARPVKQPPMARFTLESPAGAVVMPSGLFGAAQISPDGRHLAFLARVKHGPLQLCLRALDSLETRALEGTDNASFPFWAPDNRIIGFFSDKKLKMVEISGGAVQTICEIPSRGLGGTWSGDGIILFGSSEGPVYRVSVAGGRPPVPVTKLDTAAGEDRHITPWFLPDGKHFLFLGVTKNQEKRAIWTASLDDGTPTKVVAENSNPAYAAGHIFFSREQLLMAQPFDLRTRRVTGEHFVVARSLLSNYVAGLAAFTVSNAGTILYTEGSEPVQLLWLSSTGQVQGVAAPADDYWGFGGSADGTRLAVVKREKGASSADLWVIESGLGGTSRVTSGAGLVRGAVWSPDAKQIAFALFNFDNSAELSVISPTGSGQRVVAQTGGVPTSWSRDGRWLAFSEFRSDTRWNLLTYDFSNDKVTRFLDTPYAEWQGEFSPDGRWMAYVSNESGNQEVYVLSFPGKEQKVKISTAGGNYPAWSPNGDRLFYDADGSIMAVDLKWVGNDFHASSPVMLFPLPVSRSSRDLGGGGGTMAPLLGPSMRVMWDGRFLVERSPVEKRGPTIVVIVNWHPQGTTEH